jgi:hypothetical protein|tara:strand:+ start:3730 stop:3990 length:261 start_codon:yes stop_codon:yes gene_type:complete
MTVKTDHGEFEVNPLTFKDRRVLHGMEVKSIKDGDVDLSTFYHVLNWIMDFAFDDPEKSLGNLEDNQIDEVLLAIYNKYKEPSKKK